MQPTRPTFLQPDEEPLRLEARDPRSALDSWIGIALTVLLVCAGAFVLAAFVTAAAVPYAIAAAIVAVALGVVASFAVWFRVRTSVNVVTAERVYHAHGQLRFFLSQTTFDRVTDLHVHQSFFGRRFGFGTVVVQTAGHGVALAGVRDPVGMKQAIEEAREAMVRRLVAAHVRTVKAGAKGASAPGASQSLATLAPRARVGGPAAWTGKPSLSSALATAVPMLLFIVPFLLFSTFAAGATNDRGPFVWILPAVVLVFGGITVAAAFIRLRTTHYEVHAWGVAVASGWLSRRRVEARYEKVTDVAVTQNVLGRIFGFGTIRINTAGGAEAPIAFAGVRDPDRVKAIVDGARHGGPA